MSMLLKRLDESSEELPSLGSYSPNYISRQVLIESPTSPSKRVTMQEITEECAERLEELETHAKNAEIIPEHYHFVYKEKPLQIPIFMNNTLFNKLKCALKSFAEECAESKITNEQIPNYSKQLIIHECLQKKLRLLVREKERMKIRSKLAQIYNWYLSFDGGKILFPALLNTPGTEG